MSDPVQAVAENEAIGSIAEIFADIRSVYRVNAVNLIWRHLATIPGGLPWVWTTARPLYADGTVGRVARALRAGLSLPELPPWPTAALRAGEDVAVGRRTRARHKRVRSGTSPTHPRQHVPSFGTLASLSRSRLDRSGAARFRSTPRPRDRRCPCAGACSCLVPCRTTADPAAGDPAAAKMDGSIVIGRRQLDVANAAPRHRHRRRPDRAGRPRQASCGLGIRST